MAALVNIRTPSVLADDDENDDIIEIGSEPVRARSFADLIRPSASHAHPHRSDRSRHIRDRRRERVRAAGAGGSGHSSRENSRRGTEHSLSRQSSFTSRSDLNRRQQSLQSNAAQVIDLTTDESPVVFSHIQRETSQLEGSVPPTQTSITSTTSRNPRRTNSQRITPALTRSDSHLVDMAGYDVIDLTMDDEEEQSVPRVTRQRLPPIDFVAREFRRSERYVPEPLPEPADVLIEADVQSGGFLHSMGYFANRLGLSVQGIHHSLADIVGNRSNFHRPHLDVTRNAFANSGGRHHHHYAIPIPRMGGARPPSPKPPMEPIPPTTDGFTRNTEAEPEDGGEIVVVCPACNEELAYDPTEAVADSATSPSKKRKRPPGEHHFWALKKCGHVRVFGQALKFQDER